MERKPHDIEVVSADPLYKCASYSLDSISSCFVPVNKIYCWFITAKFILKEMFVNYYAPIPAKTK